MLAVLIIIFYVLQRAAYFSKNLEIDCVVCKGDRLKREALHFKIDQYSIADLARLDIEELSDWFHKISNKKGKLVKVNIQIEDHWPE